MTNLKSTINLLWAGDYGPELALFKDFKTGQLFLINPEGSPYIISENGINRLHVNESGEFHFENEIFDLHSSFKVLKSYKSKTGLTGGVLLFSNQGVFLDIGTYRVDANRKIRHKITGSLGNIKNIYFPVTSHSCEVTGKPILFVEGNVVFLSHFNFLENLKNFLIDSSSNDDEIFKDKCEKYFQIKFFDRHLEPRIYEVFHNDIRGLDIVPFTDFCVNHTLNSWVKDGYIVISDYDLSNAHHYLASKMGLKLYKRNQEYFLKIGKYGEISEVLEKSDIENFITYNDDLGMAWIFYNGVYYFYKSQFELDQAQSTIYYGELEKKYEEYEIKVDESNFMNSPEEFLLLANEAINKKVLSDIENFKSSYFHRLTLDEKLYLISIIPKIEITDSYAVGNCEVGTKRFMKEFGINLSEVSGKQLVDDFPVIEMLKKSEFVRVLKHLFIKYDIDPLDFIIESNQKIEVLA